MQFGNRRKAEQSYAMSLVFASSIGLFIRLGVDMPRRDLHKSSGLFAAQSSAEGESFPKDPFAHDISISHRTSSNLSNEYGVTLSRCRVSKLEAWALLVAQGRLKI